MQQILDKLLYKQHLKKRIIEMFEDYPSLLEEAKKYVDNSNKKLKISLDYEHGIAKPKLVEKGDCLVIYINE